MHNSIEAIVKAMLEEAWTTNTNPLSRKNWYQYADEPSILCDHIVELSMKSPVSVSKPADLGVGGPELWISGRW
jgi:hypothetical protein